MPSPLLVAEVVTQAAGRQQQAPCDQLLMSIAVATPGYHGWAGELTCFEEGALLTGIKRTRGGGKGHSVEAEPLAGVRVGNKYQRGPPI